MTTPIRTPAYDTACRIVATVSTELPRWRSEPGWIDLVESELIGLLLTVSTRKPGPEKLARILRRFAARLLHEMGLTRRINSRGRVYRRGVPLARAVLLAGSSENRAAVLLDRHYVVTGPVLEATVLYLGIWQGFRMQALHGQISSDTVAWDDAYPSGLCEEVNLLMYHVDNPM